MLWFNQLCSLYGEQDTPLFHAWLYTDIEIDLSLEGSLIAARLRREKTLAPITESSASRTVNIAPHPLCDTLNNLTKQKNAAVYLRNLHDWAEFSEDNRLLAVYRYIQRGAILSDLRVLGIDDDGGKMVRFSVNGEALFGDRRLIRSHIDFIRSQPAETALCCVSGRQAVPCRSHPKRIVSPESSAKLISCSQRNRLVYSGIIRNAEDIFPIGSEESFKAHAVLRRLINDGGIKLQNRVFVAFDKDGKSQPLPLFGASQNPNGHVTVLCLCEATKGRLSLTFYRTVSAEDYIRSTKRNTNQDMLPTRHSGYYYERLLNKILN